MTAFLRGAVFGAAFGWTVIHATAAWATEPGTPMDAIRTAYTAQFGLMLYHIAIGALLGGIASALANHAVTRQMDLERHQEDLQQQILQAQKLETIGRLTSGVAHDFNNILSAIGMQLHLAANYPENRDRSITKAQAAVKRAARLPQQLLTFSRQGAESPQRIDPNATLQAVADLMDRTVGRDITLSVDAGEVKAVRIDPVQFEQVVMNLVVNARDATAEGTITLSSTRRTDPDGMTPGEYVEVAVADTGSGIPPDVLPTIFDPFFTTKDPGKGTGLGLATCKSIVEKAGGTIRVDSRPGRTVFRILLPEVERPPPPPEEDEAPGGTETVLVAEADPDIRGGVATILESAGYAVLQARHGVEALRMVDQHDVDLVMADMALPAVHGGDLAKRLEDQGRRVRFLLTTDSAGVGPSRGMLPKPLQPDQVLRAVRDVLDH